MGKNGFIDHVIIFGFLFLTGNIYSNPSYIYTTDFSSNGTSDGYAKIDPCELNIQEPPVIIVNYPDTVYSGFVYELDGTSSYDPGQNPLTSTWIVPTNLPVSGETGLKIRFLAPVVTKSTPLIFRLTLNNGIEQDSKLVAITVLPFDPELYACKITDLEASSFIIPDLPSLAADGNSDTYWSSDGDNQWLQVKLSVPSKINYLLIDFLHDQQYASYFDIYASQDFYNWDHILTSVASCDFSGKSQVFEFPAEYSDLNYLYIKYVGHGNSNNLMNIISEFKAYGPFNPNGNVDKTSQINIYPNPAASLINISILDPNISANRVLITDLSGRIILDKKLKAVTGDLQLPLDLNPGIYVLELLSDNIIQITQKIIIIPDKIY